MSDEHGPITKRIRWSSHVEWLLALDRAVIFSPKLGLPILIRHELLQYLILGLVAVNTITHLLIKQTDTK